MKLYREVKASDRLPDEPGWYYVVQEYEEKLTQYLSWWTGKNWKEFGVKAWLEPIEITEEEIEDILRENIIYGTYGTITSKASKAILSKLKETQVEKVPDLSGLDKPDTEKFIKEFVDITAKNVLSVFVALGLKVHLEATVVNDADGNTYKLSFRKSEPQVSEDTTITDILWDECNKKGDLIDNAIFADGISIETINNIFANAALRIQSHINLIR